MEERLENIQGDLKNLLMLVFQRCIAILSEHIQSHDAQNKSHKNHWYRWMLSRLQQILFKYHAHVFNYVPILDSLLFTPDLDTGIQTVWKQFNSLRA